MTAASDRDPLRLPADATQVVDPTICRLVALPRDVQLDWSVAMDRACTNSSQTLA